MTPRKLVKRVFNLAKFNYFMVVPKRKMPFDAAFVIGFYKTGTTSMNHFLKANGLRHLTINSRVKRHYLDGDFAFLDKMVERYNSFDDTPWSKLEVVERYAQQDKDYRFILTTREPKKWFKSYQKHQRRIGQPSPSDEQYEDFVENMLTHQNTRCRNLMKRYNKPLLEIDVTTDPNPEPKILQFLDLEPRGVRFPHSNQA